MTSPIDLTKKVEQLEKQVNDTMKVIDRLSREVSLLQRENNRRRADISQLEGSIRKL